MLGRQMAFNFAKENENENLDAPNITCTAAILINHIHQWRKKRK